MQQIRLSYVIITGKQNEKTGNMNHKRLIIILISAIVLLPAAGQSVSEKRNFSRSFTAEKDTRLEVFNRYGNIKFTTWKRDSVYINAEVEAFAPNRDRLEKLLEGVEITLERSSNLVTARTSFNKSLMSLLESIKGLTDKVIDYDARVQINYFVSVPDYIDIKIDNQFGDVGLENNTNRVSAAISNGLFEAVSLNELTQLTLNLGDAEIGTMRSGRINSSFSELVLGSAGELRISSTSCRFDIKNADILDVESRRDKFFIGAAGELRGTSYFTDYYIDLLENEINMTTKYGNLDVRKCNSSFDRINLSTSYSDVTLSFDQNVSYTFEIRSANAFVVTPAKNTRSEKEVINEDKKEYLITGSYGDSKSSARVRIEASRGNINLR